VETEPLSELIPLCLERGVGITIMKPVATGLLPARLALRWLLSQSISSAVPGTTTLEELEENASVGDLVDPTLTEEELAEVEVLREGLEHVRCRICAECQPCPQDIPIGSLLGTDELFDHYRNMGTERFKAFSWSRETIDEDLLRRREMISAVESCTRCGQCEGLCPHGLPVIEMLQAMLPGMQEMISIYRGLLAGR
jgi:predicted aldo/keto reductase-like oxidoreductase